MEIISRSARKITLTLFIAQSLVSAGMIAASTLNAIVGARLSAHMGWAGVPMAVFLLGSAFAAFLWGHIMDKIGRRGGLTVGLIVGVLGAGVAFQAIIEKSWTGFLVGLALMGMAKSAMNLGRFAAAEVNPPKFRGRAISNVVLGGTVGAVFGPLLVGPTGQWMSKMGLDELSGGYMAGLVMFLIASAVIFIGLRPEPRDLGNQVAKLFPEGISVNGKVRTIPQILKQPAAALAILAMVLGQMVMVLVMVITSLAMRENQHDLGDIALVISAHTVGMFAFSVISGRLVDRWGRGPVIVIGAGVLALACLIAPLSTQVFPLAISLFLLGLGWNFCFVGGSTLLADQLSPAERARTQGFNDLLVGLVSALGSISSGLIFASLGFGIMTLIGAVIAFVLMVIAAIWLRANRSGLTATT